ncbi:outer membrane lipoprotein chaperone LolA [Legionella dresdenensis]|uniref:Outer-membrane lipoprotein carrier protein n=1 Tax=Legionella dresdenensis TaxID=450200 RepID=A0ABV8CC61_9GAMM
MRKSIGLLALLILKPIFALTAAEDVQARLNAIHSMTANFSQIVKAGKREVSSSSGTMALSRPGRFRWQTKSPMEQLVVADSQKLWVYDVDLEQVTVKKQEKGLGGTPALFLSGYDDTVNRDFTVTASGNEKTKTFDLHAKSGKENFQRVKLTFNGETLTSIEFFDQLNQHTVVKLSKIKNNPGLSDTLFKFKPPKGVDVVKQ